MKKLILILLASSFLWIAVATAQKSAGSKSAAVLPNRLIDVKITGSQRFTQKEITAMSGLMLGQNVVEADLKEAARRLGDSGFFTDVAYTFAFSSAGTKVEFQLADIDDSKLVPAHFENFVWFTDEQLLAAVRQHVPAFQPRMPVSGTMPDEVEQALQAVIDEKQIPARVDYLREAPQEGGALIGIQYQVVALEIRIRNVEFPGATPDLLPGLQAAARKLGGTSYMRSPLAQVASIEFMPVCLQRGYLKAAFADSQAHVVAQSEGEVQVDAIIPVAPGRVYSTSSVTWKGNSVFPSDDLQRQIQLPIGKPADAVHLAADLHNVEKVYHTKGYMLASVKPDASLDDGQSMVRYELNVHEGDQFKMGELEITGLDSQAKARLVAAWKLHEGDPYNSDYPHRFVNENSRLAPTGVQWQIGIREAVNEKDQTVDVTIRFVSN